MYGNDKSCLKGVYVRKKNLLNSYTGYLFCFMCCYIHWILLESCNALAFVFFLFFGFVLLDVCTYCFEHFFKISSINYILICVDMTEILLQNFISLSLITESV